MDSLPLKVHNRLQLGRDVAAEVIASRPERRAWVRVRPLIAPNQKETWWYGTSEPAFRRPGTDGSLQGYQIVYLEIDAHWMDFIDETDSYCSDPNTVREERFAPDETALVNELARWLTDLSTLRIPMDVNCPTCF